MKITSASPESWENLTWDDRQNVPGDFFAEFDHQDNALCCLRERIAAHGTDEFCAPLGCVVNESIGYPLLIKQGK